MLNNASKADLRLSAVGTTPRFNLFCALAFALTMLCVSFAWPIRTTHLITGVFFLEQDLVITGLAVALLVVSLLCPRFLSALADVIVTRLPKFSMRNLMAAMVAMVALGAIGHFAIMHDLALSLDEQMVLFDARVFSTGHLVGDVPAAWRSLVDAMHKEFLIIPPGNSKWISAYLPVNAMLHTPAIKFGLTALVNPAMAAIGLLATYCTARQLWPENRETAAVATVLYLTSTQVWAMSMTTFAMTGHLALNMIWLMCFVRGGRIGHFAAVLVGFAATGLHQIVFHPLFALPFCALLVFRREWRLAAFYAVSYALIGLFWISYTKWTVYAGVPVQAQELGGISSFLHRLYILLTDYPEHRSAYMAANLLRFFAWQNLLLLPLLVAALWALRSRKDALLIAMFAALVLTPVAMFFLLAYQGHGWGYRYMHGLIGISCLLAAAGWHHLRAIRAAPRTALTIATAATVLLSAPYLMLHTRDLLSSFAVAERLIQKQDADIVVIDGRVTGLAVDRVVPRPYLGEGPVRLMASRIDKKRLADLCRKHSVVMITNIGRNRTPAAKTVCR
jgi:hypothetical protein